MDIAYRSIIMTHELQISPTEYSGEYFSRSTPEIEAQTLALAHSLLMDKSDPSLNRKSLQTMNNGLGLSWTFTGRGRTGRLLIVKDHSLSGVRITIVDNSQPRTPAIDKIIRSECDLIEYYRLVLVFFDMVQIQSPEDQMIGATITVHMHNASRVLENSLAIRADLDIIGQVLLSFRPFEPGFSDLLRPVIQTFDPNTVVSWEFVHPNLSGVLSLRINYGDGIRLVLNPNGDQPAIDAIVRTDAEMSRFLQHVRRAFGDTSPPRTYEFETQLKDVLTRPDVISRIATILAEEMSR